MLAEEKKTKKNMLAEKKKKKTCSLNINISYDLNSF